MRAEIFASEPKHPLCPRFSFSHHPSTSERPGLPLCSKGTEWKIVVLITNKRKKFKLCHPCCINSSKPYYKSLTTVLFSSRSPWLRRLWTAYFGCVWFFLHCRTTSVLSCSGNNGELHNKRRSSASKGSRKSCPQNFFQWANMFLDWVTLIFTTNI